MTNLAQADEWFGDVSGVAQLSPNHRLHAYSDFAGTVRLRCGGGYYLPEAMQRYDYRYREGRLCRRPGCAAFFDANPT